MSTRKFSSKRKVLSNKQLTTKVRALMGTKGHSIHLSANLFGAVSLVAGTADINYFDDAGLLAAAAVNHYYDCHISLLTSTAGGATVRILYCFDEDYDDTNVTVADILAITTDSRSGYLSTAVKNLKEARHKNSLKKSRIVVVKDMLIPLINGEPKAFNIRLPLFNKVFKQIGGEINFEFLPFILALADEADVVMTMGVDHYFTQMLA